MITYRPANAQDFPSIDRLTSEANFQHFQLAPQLFAEPTLTASCTSSAAFHQDEATKMSVAELDGSVVGFVYASLVTETRPMFQPGRYAKIDTIAVQGNFRGNGIGHKLINEIENWAQELGCTEVRLNVWSVNTRAIQLYEDLGYKPMSMFMGKRLGAA